MTAKAVPKRHLASDTMFMYATLSSSQTIRLNQVEKGQIRLNKGESPYPGNIFQELCLYSSKENFHSFDSDPARLWANSNSSIFEPNHNVQ